MLDRVSAELYILTRAEGSRVRCAPLYVHRFDPRMAEKYEALPDVPDRLRWLRRSRGLLQKDAAKIAGVSRGVYTDLETGRAKQMPTEAAGRLAAFYGVPAEDLLDDYTRFLQSNPAAQLQAQRAKLGLTREAFAQILGTSVRNLEQWETGKRIISYQSWERIFVEKV